MTARTVSSEVATRPTGPGALIKQYENDFATVLPTHIKPATWVRVAQGALKRGKRNPDGRYELEVAAQSNPGQFLAALLDAARLGLEPGTEQYYLTPRKVKGQAEILGIVGYQGYIELMYRAGAVSSVTAEVVYAKDRFAYQPGRDEIPRHEIDWDAEDRGPLRLVYAYARMKDGAYSRVVVLNRSGIAKIRDSSAAAHSDSSPWNTNEESMWLKSAVRQLRKWVPTSAEYIRERAQIAAEAASSVHRQVVIDGEVVDEDTGEIVGGAIVDDTPLRYEQEEIAEGKPTEEGTK